MKIIEEILLICHAECDADALTTVTLGRPEPYWSPVKVTFKVDPKGPELFFTDQFRVTIERIEQ